MSKRREHTGATRRINIIYITKPVLYMYALN